MKINHPIRIQTIALMAAFACAISARADVPLSVPFGLPLTVNSSVDETNCNNSPGPQISFGGAIAMGGVKAKLTFSNNTKGTHTTNVITEYTVSLVTAGSVTIPKQPVNGGVGGNPYIYLQFHDGKGTDLGDEIFLGRCVQGLNLSTDLLNQALLLANVHADGCSNKKGPYITLDGTLTFSGLHARFIFRNNPKGTHTAEDVQDVTLILDGSTIVLPKQPAKGGVGGNPLISIQFLHDNGDPIGEPVLLGRCNQI